MFRAGVFAFFAAVAVFFAAPHARAQEQHPIEALSNNPYALTLFEILARWDSGALTLEKSSAAADFERRLENYGALPNDRFVVERWFSREAILEQWYQLPETLRPELRLSAGAKLLLAAAVVDKSADLERFVGPYADDLQAALASSLYITLAAAQQEALEQGKALIDATAVRRAGVRFFSLGWPFCCADEYS
jgi:hypothetical protein